MVPRLVVTLMVCCLLGTAADANPSQVGDEALSAQLEAQFNRYVSALLAETATEVQQVVSREKLQRFSSDQGKSLDAVKFKALIARERSKLLRAFGPQVTQGKRFALRGFDSLEEGRVLKAQFSIGDEILPKPVYFVSEGAEYKINFNPPSALVSVNQEISTDSYRIENSHKFQRYVGCGTSANVSATVDGASCFLGICTPGSRYLDCPNMCSASWAGSQFFGSPGLYTYFIGYCDYNTWGRDVYFDASGGGHCNDPC